MQDISVGFLVPGYATSRMLEKDHHGAQVHATVVVFVECAVFVVLEIKRPLRTDLVSATQLHAIPATL